MADRRLGYQHLLEGFQGPDPIVKEIEGVSTLPITQTLHYGRTYALMD
jgi:hypothetical protein